MNTQPQPMQATAMPRVIGDFSFNLDVDTVNRDMLAHLRSLAAARGFQIHPYREAGRDYTLCEVGDGVRGYIFAVQDDWLVYVVRYVKRFRRFLGGYAYTQLAVWRTARGRVRVPGGLSDHVFFNILFKRTGLMLSDNEQTNAGKTFWQRRMQEARQDGYRVYLWEKNGGIHGDNKLTELNDHNESDLWATGWTHKRRGWQCLFVISAKPIQTSE